MLDAIPPGRLFAGLRAALSRLDPGGRPAILVPAAHVGATPIPVALLLADGRSASMIVAVSLVPIEAPAVRMLLIGIPRAIREREGHWHAADRAG